MVKLAILSMLFFLFSNHATAGTEYYVGSGCTGTVTPKYSSKFEPMTRQYSKVFISLNRDVNSGINFFNAVNLADDDFNAERGALIAGLSQEKLWLAPEDVVLHSPVEERGNYSSKGYYERFLTLQIESGYEIKDHGYLFSGGNSLGDTMAFRLMRTFSNSTGLQKIDFTYHYPSFNTSVTSVACNNLQPVKPSQIPELIKEFAGSNTEFGWANHLFGINFETVPFYDEVEVQIKKRFGGVKFKAVAKLDKTNTKEKSPKTWSDDEYSTGSFRIAPSVENGLLPAWITKAKGHLKMIVRRKSKTDKVVHFSYEVNCDIDRGYIENCEML